MSENRLDLAVPDFVEAIRQEPTSAAFRYNLGNALLRERQLDQAIDKYTEAIRLQSDFPLAYMNRGIAYGQQGQLGKIHCGPECGCALRSIKPGGLFQTPLSEALVLWPLSIGRLHQRSRCRSSDLAKSVDGT
jgi:tetratricopeptide (TPR) repeat protein